MKLSESKVILILIIIALVILGGLFFVFKDKHNFDSDTTTTQSPNAQLLSSLAKGLPDASWSNPETMNESTGPYGEMEGQKISATITTQDATPVNFNEKEHLESLGYKEDPQLAAGGAGSSVWGYSKTENGVTSVVIFSSQTQASNANQNAPLEFNCPCKTDVSIFVSTPPPGQSASSGNQVAGLANPASVNCGEMGGTTSIKNGPNGQYGLCEFGDNMACEEWALYRGDCPVGGVKTTGYDNEAQMYCAWVGGKTLAEPNATCTLPNGKICSDEALYNGSCSSS